MKHLFYAFLLIAAIAFTACEKTIIEDGGDKKENVDDDDGSFDVDAGGGGTTDANGFTVGDVVDVKTFCTHDIGVQVYVKGYIVAAATGAGGVSTDFDAPYAYDTAILLADKPDATADDYLVSICLPSGSKYRKMFNLKDNPANKGQKIMIFGFQTVYLKMPGIKEIGAYEFPVK